MAFEKIITKFKEFMEPLTVLLGSFFIAFLIMWAAFDAARRAGGSALDDLVSVTWANDLNKPLILSTWGVVSVIILIASLAVGFCFWYLRKVAHMEKSWLLPYIDYPLIAVAGIFMEIILVTIFLKQIW